MMFRKLAATGVGLLLLGRFPTFMAERLAGEGERHKMTRFVAGRAVGEATASSKRGRGPSKGPVDLDAGEAAAAGEVGGQGLGVQDHFPGVGGSVEETDGAVRLEMDLVWT